MVCTSETRIISIQTQIHWNQFLSNIILCSRFLWIYLVITRLQCPLFLYDTVCVRNHFCQMHFYAKKKKKVHFCSCCKFILRECMHCAAIILIEGIKNEFIHMRLQIKDDKSHCIGHKNCRFTVHGVLLYFVFVFVASLYLLLLLFFFLFLSSYHMRTYL